MDVELFLLGVVQGFHAIAEDGELLQRTAAELIYSYREKRGTGRVLCPHSSRLQENMAVETPPAQIQRHVRKPCRKTDSSAKTPAGSLLGGCALNPFHNTDFAALRKNRRVCKLLPLKQLTAVISGVTSLLEQLKARHACFPSYMDTLVSTSSS